MAILQSCQLTCTERGHNKEYIIELHEDEVIGGTASYSVGSPFTYRVEGQYGRIGATRTTVQKYIGGSRLRAEAAFNKVRNEKLSKGYQEVRGQRQEPRLVTPVRARTGRTRTLAADPLSTLFALSGVRTRTIRTRTLGVETSPVSTGVEAAPVSTVEFFDDAPRRISI